MSYQYQSNTDSKLYLKKPRQYMVIMHNDDYTTMDFVVEVLISVYNKTEAEAKEIMLSIHNNGSGTAGAYVYDIAMTKKIQTEQLAGQKGFPLRITLDEMEG